MSSTLRKIILATLALGVTVLVLFIIRPKDKEAAEQKTQSLKAIKPLAITTGTNVGNVAIRGKIEALEKIDILAEVGGIMNASRYFEGNSFRKGETLLSINSDELAYSLKAQKSSLLNKVSGIIADLTLDFPNDAPVWQAFMNDIDIAKPLPELPVINDNNLKRFISSKDILNSYFTIKANEKKLSKYVIRAPFNGSLTATQIKNGSLVRIGQPLGSFMNTSRFEMTSEVSLSELKLINTGDEITLKASNSEKTWRGTIDRINATISPETQMAQIYISIVGDELKEGMYLFGTITGESFDNTVEIDRKLIKNGGVYTLEKDRIDFKEVEILFESNSKAIVSGLSNKDVLVANNVNGVYVGQQVNVVSE